jgi:hypothetical protein
MYQFVACGVNETIFMKCKQYISPINIGFASSPQGFMTIAACNVGEEILREFKCWSFCKDLKRCLVAYHCFHCLSSSHTASCGHTSYCS